MQFFPSPSGAFGYERLWVINGSSGRPNIFFGGKPLEWPKDGETQLTYEIDFEGEIHSETLDFHVTSYGGLVLTYRTPGWCGKSETIGTFEVTVICEGWSRGEIGFSVNGPTWLENGPDLFVVASRLALLILGTMSLGLVILLLATFAGLIR